MWCLQIQFLAKDNQRLELSDNFKLAANTFFFVNVMGRLYAVNVNVNVSADFYLCFYWLFIDLLFSFFETCDMSPRDAVSLVRRTVLF